MAGTRMAVAKASIASISVSMARFEVVEMIRRRRPCKGVGECQSAGRGGQNEVKTDLRGTLVEEDDERLKDTVRETRTDGNPVCETGGMSA